MPAPIVTWTDEMVASLTERWESGDFASDVALAMSEEFQHRFSRNMILGKAHRLKLRTPNKPSKPKAKKKPVQRKKIIPRRPLLVSAIPDMPIEPVRKDVWAACEDSISILSVTDKTCRWPLAESNFVFCGHDVERGRYCSHHASIAYKAKETK